MDTNLTDENVDISGVYKRLHSRTVFRGVSLEGFFCLGNESRDVYIVKV